MKTSWWGRSKGKKMCRKHTGQYGEEQNARGRTDAWRIGTRSVCLCSGLQKIISDMRACVGLLKISRADSRTSLVTHPMIRQFRLAGSSYSQPTPCMECCFGEYVIDQDRPSSPHCVLLPGWDGAWDLFS